MGWSRKGANHFYNWNHVTWLFERVSYYILRFFAIPIEIFGFNVFPPLFFLSYLRKNHFIRWNAVKRWCKQILKGLAFLHSQNIIHRDIKCDNIFINGSTGDLRIGKRLIFHAVLFLRYCFHQFLCDLHESLFIFLLCCCFCFSGDLGLSTRISEQLMDKAREITASSMTCLGTPEFMAPELYDANYDEKVDVYAFGMTVLEMVTGFLPYHECTTSLQIYKKVCDVSL